MPAFTTFQPTPDELAGQRQSPRYLDLLAAWSELTAGMAARDVAALETTIRKARTLAQEGYYLEETVAPGRYWVRGGTTTYTYDAGEQRCSCPCHQARHTCKHSIAAAAGSLPIRARRTTSEVRDFPSERAVLSFAARASTPGRPLTPAGGFSSLPAPRRWGAMNTLQEDY